MLSISVLLGKGQVSFLESLMQLLGTILLVLYEEAMVSIPIKSVLWMLYFLSWGLWNGWKMAPAMRLFVCPCLSSCQHTHLHSNLERLIHIASIVSSETRVRFLLLLPIHLEGPVGPRRFSPVSPKWLKSGSICSGALLACKSFSLFALPISRLILSLSQIKSLVPSSFLISTLLIPSQADLNVYLILQKDNFSSSCRSTCW